LAVSADYSFVAKSATMTLHPIRTSGTLITAESTFEYMKKTQERVVDFIVEHSKAKKEDIIEKMNCTDNMANDVGTLLFGKDAVEIGIIDEIGSLNSALTKLRQMI
jgi:ATP-dependent protease ClpP protease subunit